MSWKLGIFWTLGVLGLVGNIIGCVEDAKDCTAVNQIAMMVAEYCRCLVLFVVTLGIRVSLMLIAELLRLVLGVEFLCAIFSSADLRVWMKVTARVRVWHGLA